MSIAAIPLKVCLTTVKSSIRKCSTLWEFPKCRKSQKPCSPVSSARSSRTVAKVLCKLNGVSQSTPHLFLPVLARLRNCATMPLSRFANFQTVEKTVIVVRPGHHREQQSRRVLVTRARNVKRRVRASRSGDRNTCGFS